MKQGELMNLIYDKNMVYPWKYKESIYFRGYFIYDFKLYKEFDAINFITHELKELSIDKLLKKINGLFSIVIDYKEKEEVILVVDRLRNLPLFYSQVENSLLISNNLNNIKDELNNFSVDEEAFLEISITEKFVTNNKTLIKEIKQVNAGQYIVFNNINCEFQYIDYFTHGEIVESDNSAETIFSKAFRNSAKNLSLTLDGRTAVIPLTGGVDSREVLFMLSSINYSNVICYTCGKMNSKEVKIAEKVAKSFGYKWIGIEYTKEKWQKLSSEKILDEYRVFSSNYSSLPHMLEIVGVEELKRSGKLPEDSVFIPGHAGAIIGGRIPNEFHEKRDIDLDMFNKIMIREFYMDNPEGYNYFDTTTLKTQDDFLNFFHEFEMKERQSKFICNSIRLYEFFGYEWVLPLCDINFLESMKKIPLKYKKEKRIARDFMGMDHIESTADQSFQKSVAIKIRQKSFVRKNVRKLSKISKYWTDPLQTSGLYGKKIYFKTMYKGNEFFSINSIEKEVLLSKLKKEVCGQ